MADPNPLTPGGMLERVFQLEDQVKGLVETVNQLHQAYHLQALNIPKPDQYVRTGAYKAADVNERMPRNLPAKTGTESKPTEPNAEEGHSPSTNGMRLSASQLSNLSPYTYSPLNLESSEIRILALKASSSPTEPITCRLVSLTSWIWFLTPGTAKLPIRGIKFMP